MGYVTGDATGALGVDEFTLRLDAVEVFGLVLALRHADVDDAPLDEAYAVDVASEAVSRQLVEWGWRALLRDDDWVRARFGALRARAAAQLVRDVTTPP